MRNKKMREFERKQEEVQKEIDRMVRLKERTLASKKQNEAALKRNNFTYNTNGEIIFFQRVNPDKLPDPVYHPPINSHKNPDIFTPSDTIHKVKNIEMSESQIIEDKFNTEEHDSDLNKAKARKSSN